MATLWKVALSPDYLDGRFFRVTMLTDVRFEGFAQLAGGLTRDQLESYEGSSRNMSMASFLKHWILRWNLRVSYGLRIL